MSFLKYISFYFKSSTKYQVHSPFVFDFVEHILEDKRQYYFFRTIEQYRRLLLGDSTKIEGDRLKINTLTRKLAIKRDMGRLLFRLVHHYKPKNALLVGVFPGIAGLYQSTPSYKMLVKGLESNKAVESKLTGYFQKIGVPNIHLVYGEVTKLVKDELQGGKKLDYVYLKELPPKSILMDMMNNCTTQSIIVLDRPYQSEARQVTWQWLKTLPTVTISIDLYHLGILFFRKEQKEKVDYQLIKSAYKPWSVF